MQKVMLGLILLCFGCALMLLSFGCANATQYNAINEPNAGHAGSVIRKVSKPSDMGNGTHRRGMPEDKKERKSMENRSRGSSNDARNSSTRT